MRLITLLVNDLKQVTLVKLKIKGKIIPTKLLSDNLRSSKNLPFQILEGWNLKVGSYEDIEHLVCLSFQMT